jgi:hypothetical protein
MESPSASAETGFSDKGPPLSFILVDPIGNRIHQAIDHLLITIWQSSAGKEKIDRHVHFQPMGVSLVGPLFALVLTTAALIDLGIDDRRHVVHHPARIAPVQAYFGRVQTGRRLKHHDDHDATS